MLRFRNLTGSHFSSAAQAKFQDHDTVVVKGGPRFHSDDENGAGGSGLGLGGTAGAGEGGVAVAAYQPPVG